MAEHSYINEIRAARGPQKPYSSTEPGLVELMKGLNEEEMKYNYISAQLPIASRKSTALVAGMLQPVDRKLKHPQVICIVPTRESAVQIWELLLKMGNHSPITCVLGLPPSKADYKPLALMPPVEAQVITGTPFTIHKWIVAKKLNIDGLKMLLVDDVDLLLAEPGFKDNVVRITKDISKRSPQCQVILCSAISNDAVDAFVSKTKEVLPFTGKMEVPSSDNVEQYKVNAPEEPSKLVDLKNILLDHIGDVGQTIIFLTEERARILCKTLEDNRFKFKTLDGADTQEQTDKILEEFKKKQFQILISTKPLVGGFDMSQVL